jgi:endoglucanase
MRHYCVRWSLVGSGLVLVCATLSCGDRALPDIESSWAALMDDGDVSAIAPAAAARPTPMTPPARFCPSGDCARDALALWTLDDCNEQSTALSDTAFTSPVQHPAFRSVSATCVAGRDNQGVHLAGGEDIVFAPDQPDFVFDGGLTIAAWINPDRVTGTQSIVRKRLDASSSIVLAIEGRRLNFVLRLTNGRLVGVSAPIQARRFTHVAATYDGHQAILYLDGTVAARTRASGAIAPGAGPIFFGNDANGRAFRGTLDTIWLNTLAAPADAVLGLTCVRKAPVVSLSPSETPPTPPETPVAFDLSVTNANDANCPVDTFQFFLPALPFGWNADVYFGSLSVATGETGHATINVIASEATGTGAFPIESIVFNSVRFSLQATATATFVVAPPAPPPRTGCATTPTQPVAPGGYYVNGNTVCTADGRSHLFHGVDRPSLEWSSVGVNLSLADFRKMASWNANVVRIGLNQDFWIAESPLADPNYASLVDSAIRWAEIAGMDVILDLHWSDRGVLGGCDPAGGCQQLMPDANSLRFWTEVATRYRNDGRVMFELYNEPHDVSWDVWRNGGDTGQGWQAVGMQQIYDAVRATGAENLVVIGGLDWAYDLSGVPANRIDGHNIVYATHPYRFPGAFQREPALWGTFWGFLARTDPVIVTEFGDISGTCATDYAAQVIDYADFRYVSWTSWAWFPGGCTFTALVTDWAGTPSPLGDVVKPALLRFNDPPASPPRSGGDNRDVSYPFDVGSEGWSLGTYDGDPVLRNIAVSVPPGGAPTSFLFDVADGDPSSGPGSMKVTTVFTALDQYVDTIVGFGQPGFNWTGKTLHAMVRLASGDFPDGGVNFYALSGAGFAFTGVFTGSDQFPPGEWVPLTLDLNAGTQPGFDPSEVVQIGIQFYSGFSDGGGTFTGSGPAVFEIDTVTD